MGQARYFFFMDIKNQFNNSTFHGATFTFEKYEDYQGIKNQFNNSTFHNVTFHFEKYEDYQTMVGELKEYEEMLADIPETKAEKRAQYTQKIELQKQQIEQYKQEVLRLANMFDKIDLNSERLKQAKSYFEAGKLREADAILKTEDLQQDQQSLLDARKRNEEERKNIVEQLHHNALEFVLKARLRATQFDEKRMSETISFFEQALASDRSLDNLCEYAEFLYHHNQFLPAQTLYEEILSLVKDNEKEQPTLYTVLNDLGSIYLQQGQTERANNSFDEAIEVIRNLSKQQPDFLPYLVMALTNKSTKLISTWHLKEAQILLEEGYQICNNFQKQEAILPHKALLMNNLGEVARYNEQVDEAQKYYAESLDIYQKLMVQNPDTYQEYVGHILFNIASLQHDALLYQQSLDIFRALAQKKPEKHLHDVGLVLNNYANLLAIQESWEESKKMYEEALQIYRSLAKQYPLVYSPELVTFLNNLCDVLLAQNIVEETKKLYTEALQISENLYAQNIDLGVGALAHTSIRLSVFYWEYEYVPEKAVDFAEKALNIVAPFQENNPQMQNYFALATDLLSIYQSNFSKN
jgi:tetratricopeptide (TPR) repeat protein